MGKKYGLAGELHLIGEDGQDKGTVAKAETEFTADMSTGTQKVDFKGIDASEMGGCKLVAYEYLYDGSDELATRATRTRRSPCLRSGRARRATSTTRRRRTPRP